MSSTEDDISQESIREDRDIQLPDLSDRSVVCRVVVAIATELRI